MDQGKGRLKPEHVATLPAVAAILIGFIYGIGAFVRGIELEDGDVSVVDAFPLIPIEQHLSRGIQLLVSPDAITVYLALLIGFVAAGFVIKPLNPASRRRVGRTNQLFASLSARLSGRKMRRLVGIGLILILIAVAVYRPIPFGLALVELMILYVALLLTIPTKGQLELPVSTRNRPLRDRLGRARPGRGTFIFIVLTAIALTVGASALLDPRPLPDVTLEKKTGERLDGRLITVTDKTWYVSTTGDSEPFTAVSFEAVRWSRVTQSESKDPSPVDQTLPALLSGD